MVLKIGILSDIHGNVTALKAVLAHAKSQGVTEYWHLGDTFLPGPADSEVLELFSGINLTAQVLGNWDQSILAILAGQWDLERHSHIYLARMVQYLLERSRDQVLTYVKSLPMTTLLERAGLTFHLSHHLPDQNGGRLLLPQGKQEDFDRLFVEDSADVAVYGHTHHQLLRYSSQDQLIINPGSIGQPYCRWPGLQKDLRAQYAILTLDDRGLSDLTFHKVAFDVKAELALAKQRQLPHWELYQELLETGVLHTHDEQLLKDLHQKFPYQAEVAAYFGKSD